MLQSGVAFNVIALWLGYESTATTHQYVEANLANERAGPRATPGTGQPARTIPAAGRAALVPRGALNYVKLLSALGQTHARAGSRSSINLNFHIDPVM
ncbi:MULTISPECIES: hypothetical protein [unclassified Thiocapsa]